MYATGKSLFRRMTVELFATDDDTKRILGPYFENLVALIRGAAQALQTSFTPEARAIASRRTSSSLMYDRVRHALKEFCGQIEGIQVRERYGQIRLIFGSDLAMKVKQARNGRISYIPTQLALQFVHQLQQLELNGMPPPLTNVHLKFEFNSTRTDIIAISIACPRDRNDNYWEFRVPIEPPTVSMLEQAPAEIPPEQPRLVVPKTKKDRKNRKPTKRGTRRNNDRTGETA